MAAPSQPSRQDGMEGMARPEAMRIKGWMDFIITLVVVNSNCTFLLVALLNKIVTR
ncbi:hypothetical protein COCCADRAFT_111043 [Bipolaris zeicola 26-R-13]|uniref:Uncharacterized protein n=1 Tax=Cochliobolus carbonum (strain 26-R-13) TaxID=930089 RepID=W6XQU9_COCC2|nr:uncharacterized protein COCCADRAFT_111043 [Bipolaris zeicola 26-R-13]EUC27680.1 hypothetical protein COCCADRAFT_111043 [Bipolaris zeicola 26-R-13]